MWLFPGQRFRYSRLSGSSSLVSRAAVSPVFSVLLVFFVLYLLSGLIVQHSSQRDPTSWFFNPEKAYDPIYSTVRQRQADNFIDNISNNKQQPLVKFKPTTGDDTLCVGIVTFARNDVRYFRSTIGSLLQGLDPEERRRLFLIVFLAHTDPTVHPAFSETWLHEAADQVLTYNISGADFDRISSLEREGGLFREKALLDYTYLLKACSKVEAPYMAIFEDDIIAMDGWFHRTEDAIAQAETQTVENHHTSDFLYLRLFYTEKFLGWNSEEWPKYLGRSLFAFAFLASTLFVVKLYSPKMRSYLTNSVVAVLCCICLPMVIFLIFAAGKITMAPLPSGVHEMNNFGCCSQGLVYSYSTAQNLINWYEQKKVGFVDMLTEEYGDVFGSVRWALTPSVIQHIGRKSSKEDDYGPNSKHGRSVAETIWNFGFELNDATTLRKEHDKISHK